jgi:hypothetical protein
MTEDLTAEEPRAFLKLEPKAQHIHRQPGASLQD